MKINNSDDELKVMKAFATLADFWRDDREMFLLLQLLRTFFEVKEEYRRGKRQKSVGDDNKLRLVKG